MTHYVLINGPASQDDSEGAFRAFTEFLMIYQPVLVRAEYYLAQVIEQVDEPYKRAYVPWQKALRDLLKGAFLISKRTPLPDSERFTEALGIFSLESAAKMLRDICVSCLLPMKQGWSAIFQRNVQVLQQAYQVLIHQFSMQHGVAR